MYRRARLHIDRRSPCSAAKSTPADSLGSLSCRWRKDPGLSFLLHRRWCGTSSIESQIGCCHESTVCHVRRCRVESRVPRCAEVHSDSAAALEMQSRRDCASPGRGYSLTSELLLERSSRATPSDPAHPKARWTLAEFPPGPGGTLGGLRFRSIFHGAF